VRELQVLEVEEVEMFVLFFLNQSKWFLVSGLNFGQRHKIK
jgi:hypothetical protein